MATVKLTIRVRDALNRVRVQDSREVSPMQIPATAQDMATDIQRSFLRATLTRAPKHS
jgi:hypothetical protein